MYENFHTLQHIKVFKQVRVIKRDYKYQVFPILN